MFDYLAKCLAAGLARAFSPLGLEGGKFYSYKVSSGTSISIIVDPTWITSSVLK